MIGYTHSRFLVLGAFHDADDQVMIIIGHLCPNIS
jgi:hypothetical protein